MRLRRLELFGFKSFADRTALEFQGTLTGIVGPNGCGKSNVVDAVRWALGEQRPTSMRGGEMADVIFKGSVSRPAMGVAEVTLTLDNEDGSLGERGSEVAITRRVFRSGEGEYLIEGERVRLKDVRDMLYDTGLGSRGYAVLEQGRIDAVLSANPLDRRAVFEEAAGISRYRQRRKETEARLKRVEADVLRLDDVLRELGTRVRSLKIQAGKAERYVAARDEWRAERSRALRHRLLQHRTSLSRLAREIAALEARDQELRELRSGGESDVAQRQREQLALSAEVDRLSGEVARLAGDVRACDERHAQLLARAKGARAASAEESTRALELARALELREAEAETLEQRARSLEEGLASQRERAAAETERLAEARAAWKSVRALCERQNEAVLGALHRKTEARNSLVHLDEARGRLAERRARLDARLDDGRRAARELGGGAGEAEERRRWSAAELERAEGEAAALAAAREALERDAAELRRSLARRELERARASSRIEALRDWEREREALESGARALLAGQAAGSLPGDAGALAGLVADHLRASTRLARALDAALGPAALGLVAASPELAGALLRWLRASGEEGQVRLYVPGTLGSAPAARAADGELLGRVEGALLDAVEVDPGFEPLARLLAGDVLIVRDLERGLELVRERPEWRYVTAEGELVEAAGVLGGRREIAQGAVGRRASARELEVELARLDEALADDARRLAALERELDAAEERGAGLARELEARRGSLAQAEGDARTARARLADLEGALGELERERRSLEEEAQRLEADLDRSRASIAASEADFERDNAALAALEGDARALEERSAEAQRAEGEAQLAVARTAAELEGLGARARDLRRMCEESAAELERARRLAREQAASAEASVEEAERVRADGDRALGERAEAEERLDALRRSERAGREAMQGQRQRVDAVTRELEELAAALARLRLDEQRAELARAELAGRAQEDLAQSEDELLEDFEPERALAEESALAELDAQVAELKRRLDQLGPVNTDAVAELEEAQQRFDFLDAQRRDLAASRRTLEETVRTIDEESVRLFLETFEDVRAHFGVLFRQLFGGGRADLELAAGMHPLEAGIEITARPPGREMLPIGLLSGGQRTMTALALLFAVFRARPSPFCVLDEVDAALDDANVGRFLAMLDGFRTDTQFIVVTHNKGTMAACERLYGITMETKGVSRHVAVEFGDVDRYVPEATGDASQVSRSREETHAGAPPGSESSEQPEGETGEEPAGTNGDARKAPSEVEEASSEPVVMLRPQRRKPTEPARSRS